MDCNKSINSSTPYKLAVTNKTGGDIQVIWLDYDGKEVLYDTLASGKTYNVDTYATHPWVMRDAESKKNLARLVGDSSTNLALTVG